MVSTTTRSEARAEATYVYCLVESKRAPQVAALPPGLDEMGPIRCVKVRPGRFLVVADAPLARYDEPALQAGLKDLDWVSECAMRHEAVVDALIGKGALVPMKLFTLFHDDERALAHVRAREAAIDEVVARVDGQVEMGLRILARPKASSSRGKRAESGAEFLRMKKEKRDAAKHALDDARAAARKIFDEVAARSSASVERELPAEGSRVLLDGVVLMKERPGRALFDEMAAREHEHAAEGVAVVVTGPWPPYHFIGSAS